MPGVWKQEPKVDQARSGHHTDEDYDHEGESLHSEDKRMWRKDNETEAHDR